MVGADVAALRQLGADLRRAADRLDELRADIASSVGSSPWHGPDADDFRGAWSSRSALVTSARDALRAAATTLDRNADDQQATSDDLTGTVFQGAPGVPGAPGNGGGGPVIGPAGPLATSGSPWDVTTSNGVFEKADGGPTDPGRNLPEDAPEDGKAPVGSLTNPEVSAALGGAHVDAFGGLKAATSGSFGSESGGHGSGEASASVGVEGQAGADASIGNDGLVVGAYAAGAVGASAAAKGDIGYGMLQAQGEANAFAGARAQAGTSATFGPDGASAQVGVDAFAGAEASASGSAGLEGAQVGATATAWAGVGFSANASVDVGWDKTEASFDFGAALGVGGDLKFTVDIEPKKLADGITHLFGF
jgi:hypothetical protein